MVTVPRLVVPATYRLTIRRRRCPRICTKPQAVLWLSARTRGITHAARTGLRKCTECSRPQRTNTEEFYDVFHRWKLKVELVFYRKPLFHQPFTKTTKTTTCAKLIDERSRYASLRDWNCYFWRQSCAKIARIRDYRKWLISATLLANRQLISSIMSRYGSNALTHICYFRTLATRGLACGLSCVSFN